MLFKKQRFDWLVVALCALGVFLYASYQPRFRLRPTMPAEFMDEPVVRVAATSALEPKVAGAYWGCLVNIVQWQYGYGHTLPANPPADFAAGIYGLAGEDA